MAHTIINEKSDRTAVNALRVAILCSIAEAVESGLPAPLSIHLHNHGGKVRVQLRMDDNAPEEVDAWATFAGAVATPGTVVHRQNYDTPWRAYKAGGIGAGVQWHGWEFEVWSVVHEPEGAES